MTVISAGAPLFIGNYDLVQDIKMPNYTCDKQLKYLNTLSNKFHEYKNYFRIINKYSLFKSVKREYERPSTNTAAMALTQTESTGHYEDKTVYFLYHNGNLKEVRLKRKEFLEAVDDDRDKMEVYMKTHNGNFNETYIVKMLVELN